MLLDPDAKQRRSNALIFQVVLANNVQVLLHKSSCTYQGKKRSDMWIKIYATARPSARWGFDPHWYGNRDRDEPEPGLGD